MNDTELMEASLAAAADAPVELRIPLFERFFEAFPDRRETFINADAASRRMTDETLQMMHGLATDEAWVWPLVAELVFTHRSYGYLPMEEYDVFIDMTVEALGEAAASAWSAECEAAWRRQAERLKSLIVEAREDWTRIMPKPELSSLHQ
jgi:hemoglobin-like flavoprotein